MVKSATPQAMKAATKAKAAKAKAAAKASAAKVKAKAKAKAALQKEREKMKADRERERERAVLRKKKDREKALRLKKNEREKALRLKKKDRAKRQAIQKKARDQKLQLREKVKKKREMARIKGLTNRHGVYTPRRMTSYLKFQTEVRSEVQKLMPSASFGEISRQIGCMWRELVPEKRKIYDDQYARDNQRRDELVRELPVPPKRPCNNYFLFMQEKKEEVTRNNPNLDIGATQGIIAGMWKALTDAQRKPYSERAVQLREQYSREMGEFNAKYPNYGKIPLSDFMAQDHVIGKTLEQWMVSA